MLSVQKLYEAVINSHSVHNLFEIGLMKGVRYFVEVLGVRYFVEVLGQCLRPSTFDDIVHRSRTGGAKVQVTGHRSQDRSRDRSQVTGHIEKYL